MSSKFRKHPSGHVKRQKKQRIEKLNQSQRGALDKFLVKGSNVSSESESAEVSNDDTRKT
jgi:hypothetical protein